MKYKKKNTYKSYKICVNENKFKKKSHQSTITLNVNNKFIYHFARIYYYNILVIDTRTCMHIMVLLAAFFLWYITYF